MWMTFEHDTKAAVLGDCPLMVLSKNYSEKWGTSSSRTRLTNPFFIAVLKYSRLGNFIRKIASFSSQF